MLNIKNVWKNKEYDKIKNDKNVKDKIVFITLGGSYAYGTNIKDSDIDIRGIILTPIDTLLANENFEQVIDNKTDTTLYTVNKIFSLLINCNPNCIELLGCKDYLIENEKIANIILDNKKLFLSKKAINSFGGYASQQLHRLNNQINYERFYAAPKEIMDPLEYEKRIKKLDKHAMHLCRLYLMLFDILEKEEINTYRENDIELLMNIRNGKYRSYDNTYKPEFFWMIDNFEERIKCDAENTNLPEKPNYDKIKELLIEINKLTLKDMPQ